MATITAKTTTATTIRGVASATAHSDGGAASASVYQESFTFQAIASSSCGTKQRVARTRRGAVRLRRLGIALFYQLAIRLQGRAALEVEIF